MTVSAGAGSWVLLDGFNFRICKETFKKKSKEIQKRFTR